MNDGLYARLYLWLVAHRRVVLAVVVLIMAACAVVSSRLDLEEDILAILPQRDEAEVISGRFTDHDGAVDDVRMFAGEQA